MLTEARRWIATLYICSLLSGYKSNRINWLPISYKSLPQSDV
jgi:hypothetical protein